jgi:hypothetical protein
MSSDIGTDAATRTIAESRVLSGPNPFDLDPRSDFLASPRHDVALWSETMFFKVWSPAEGVGFWLHMGVVPEDKTMWWAQTFAMLPDGVVLVDRSFGRPSDDRGPDTGNLKVRCVEPHHRWTLSFDGAGEVSSTEQLGQGLVGAGIAAPFRFDVVLDAVVPVYDMHAAMGRQIDWQMGGLHHEQGFTASGTLSALGESWTIQGTGIRDHSRGERHFARWGGHVWNYVVWPQSKRSLCAFNFWSPQGETTATVAMIMQDGQTELSGDFDITGMSAPGVHPNAIEMSIVRADGSLLELTGEVVHNITMTYAEPNHNLNGVYIDPRADVDATIADESVVRWTWPDGEVGYGNFERGFRPSFLPRLKIPLAPTSVFHT